MLEEGHGTALDRVSAFQMGFVSGASECATIDIDEIEQRRGDLPMALPLDESGDVQSGEVPLDEDILHPDGGAGRGLPAGTRRRCPTTPTCTDAQPSPPASYCPETNTISVDLGSCRARRGRR